MSKLQTPGDATRELLATCDGDERLLAYNIRQNPQHWIWVILTAVPFFAINRAEQAAAAWLGD